MNEDSPPVCQYTIHIHIHSIPPSHFILFPLPATCTSIEFDHPPPLVRYFSALLYSHHGDAIYGDATLTVSLTITNKTSHPSFIHPSTHLCIDVHVSIYIHHYH